VALLERSKHANHAVPLTIAAFFRSPEFAS
jgi:hypothetical protein